jgi:ABC-2 type transport system permease protein
LGLVFYIAIYYVMPDNVDETFRLAWSGPGLPEELVDSSEVSEEAGLEIEQFDTVSALQTAVEEGDYAAGIVMPQNLEAMLQEGEQGQVDIYFSAETPPELQDAATVLLQELLFAMLGDQSLNLTDNTTILGPDFAGQQIPLKDQLLPLMAVFVVLTEMLGLSSLISEEVEARTLNALLITPLTTGSFFIAKGISGVSLAFVQAVILLAITGRLGTQTVLILVALLLGALMVTGIGFLIASVAKDIMSVFGWGFPVLLLMAIPSLAVLIPDLTSDWIKVIPSYYLADTVHRAANFNAGWDVLWSNLVVMLGASLLFGGLGVLALRRKTV